MPAATRHLVLAIVSTTALLTLACNQDRVTAPKSGLRAVTPPTRVNSSHPNNSPDQIIGQFQARNTSNAKTSTDTAFGFRVKWHTTYKVTVYDWADQVANGFPISELHPIALSGVVTVRRSSGMGSTWQKEFSHPEAGPVSLYLTLTAADSVQKVSTNGAGSIDKTGTYPDGTPFWCGPSYPAHGPCYRYEGAPGNATFERLNAEAQLTADSSSAGYNSTVTYSLKAVPSHVEGQEMAVIIDNTSWIPDADSVGGDPTDVATWGACTWSGPVSNKTCTRKNKSSGTLKVVGAVNGKHFEKTWHISRTDAYPIVTPTKYYVNVGQIDTFTVRMSDGSAFGMSRWDWFADSGVKQTVLGCSVWANPCNNTAIRESGWMRARVVHNSVYKYSRAHVTVGPRPRLQLDADKSSIILGDTIRFTTSADDAPYSITSWTYHKTGVTSCETDKTCDHAPMHSGRMWVFGVVDGEPDTAYVDIAVGLNSDGSDISGLAPDSTMLMSAGAARLKVDVSDGVDAIPAEGIHVFPTDTVIRYSFLAQPGYVGLVAIKDDTITGHVDVTSMTRDHTLEAAVDPDWLADPVITDLKQQLENLLSTTNKPAAYADLLAKRLSIARHAGTDYALRAYEVAEHLAFDPYRGDTAALRVMEDSLSGFAFKFHRVGDSVAVSYARAFFPIALRRSGEIAKLQSDSLQTVSWVNGVFTSVKGAQQSEALLLGLVEEAGLPATTEVTHWYNPTIFANSGAWSAGALTCSGVWQRSLRISHPLVAAAVGAACMNELFIRFAIEFDLSEAAIQRVQIEHQRLMSVDRPGFVDTLAKRINQEHQRGRDVILVAHSQGNMMVAQAVNALGTINETTTCTALLSFASPISRASIPIADSYLRMMRVPGDVLELVGAMDGSIPSYSTDRSDTLTARLQQPTPEGWPVYIWQQSLKAILGVGIHESTHNYFRHPSTRVVSRTNLRHLSDTCRADP